MDLLRSLAVKAIIDGGAEIVVPAEERIRELVELRCYKTLERIRSILSDDELEDNACFLKIEAIIAEFDALGVSCGSRHDF